MNEQRKIIYSQRMEIINNSSIDNLIDDMRHDFIDEMVENVIPTIDEFNDEIENKLKNEITKFLNISTEIAHIRKKQNFVKDDLKDLIRSDSDNLVNKKRTEYGNEIFTMAQKAYFFRQLIKAGENIYYLLIISDKVFLFVHMGKETHLMNINMKHL